MKKISLLLVSLFVLVSCNVSLKNSSSNISSDSNTSQLESEDVSSEKQNVSSDEQVSSISNEDIETSEDINSESSQGRIDNSEKEYYKSLVDRSKINYTKYNENDNNAIVRKLEIFEINDTHGAYYEDGSVIGISRVKTCFENQTTSPYGTIKIANGDLMQGTAFSNMLLGEPAIAACNELNMDAFVIGNHEFDWGFNSLACYKDGNPDNGELNCPFLGANILDASGNMPNFVEPYTVVNKGDVRVGIIGMMGDGEENSISKVALSGYHFSDTVECAKKYCKILDEQENCDIIIIAVHAHEQDINQKYASNCKVDAIINAHDHWKVEESVTRKDGISIPVCESNTKNITVGKVTLNLDSNKQLDSYSINHYYADNYSKDSNMESIMNTYYEVVSEYQTKKIAYKRTSTSKEQLANEVCTHISEKYNADLVFVNTGGIRATLWSGNITIGNLYEALPFDNELYLAYLTGNEIKQMIKEDYMSNYYYNTNKIGQGSKYDYSNIIDNKEYKVITVDYVATKDYMSNYFSVENGLVYTSDYIRDNAIEYYEKTYKI